MRDLQPITDEHRQSARKQIEAAKEALAQLATMSRHLDIEALDALNRARHDVARAQRILSNQPTAQAIRLVA